MRREAQEPSLGRVLTRQLLLFSFVIQLDIQLSQLHVLECVPACMYVCVLCVCVCVLAMFDYEKIRSMLSAASCSHSVPLYISLSLFVPNT